MRASRRAKAGGSRDSRASAMRRCCSTSMTLSAFRSERGRAAGQGGGAAHTIAAYVRVALLG
eukprot:123934-Rhodomonas_salina.1